MMANAWQCSHNALALLHLGDRAFKRKPLVRGGVAMQEGTMSTEPVINGPRLEGKTVAFTTPSLYAHRLQHLLQQEGATTVWCPSITVESTAQTSQDVHDCLCGSPSSSSPPFTSLFSGIAFTSRAGIRAVAEVLQKNPHLLSQPIADGFFVAALGKDAELLVELDMVGESRKHVTMVVPSVATPQALVEELGDGHGRSILCPVPSVEGLEEPSVVPDFLEALLARGWRPRRLNAYATRWAGEECARPLLPLQNLDALVFTSTAEVEGMLKSLKVLGITTVRRSGTKPIIAAHGPVTAAGAVRLGIQVDVVSKNFHSFYGIIDALYLYWKSPHEPP